VLATQTIWQKKPRRMRLRFDGTLGPGVGAKDLALNWIARLGADGGRGHAIEYAGSAVRALSVEGRLTLCNLSIEGGARLGLVAPDATTLDWLKGRPFAPAGADWDRDAEAWAGPISGEDAAFDREVAMDAAEIAPIVTGGTSPEDALPITATIPDPDRAGPAADRIRVALDYMGLQPGRPLAGTPVDQVFIGSCTNTRIKDLRAAAAVLAGRKVKVPGRVSPGSAQVAAQAVAEGLDRVFTEAGLDWVGSGCSMCVGMNGDLVPPGPPRRPGRCRRRVSRRRAPNRAASGADQAGTAGPQGTGADCRRNQMVSAATSARVCAAGSTAGGLRPSSARAT
ncbi:MAG: aconitase family protein, partial [Gemmobacter sp.]